MSNQLLNIGASGMQAMAQGMTVIGNNIANSRTSGYKSGFVTFEDAFYSQTNTAFNEVQNPRGQGVQAAATSFDWGNGVTEDDGVATHLAIVGNGFFPVTMAQNPGPLQYSRSGDFSFTANPDGAPSSYVLMRPSGAMLTDVAGALLTFDAIPESFVVRSNGVIDVNAGVTVSNPQLGLQTFGNPDSLTHNASGLFEVTSGTVLANATPVTPGSLGTGVLRQAALEASNVDLVAEFTNMIAVQRAFQANSKTVTTADTMLQDVLALKR